MRIILFFTAIAISGCTSTMLDQRKLAHSAVDSCSTQKSSLYFSSTKQDLAITLAPLLQLTGAPCDKYTGADCDNIATGWLLIAPFTAMDTPLALAKDLYMIPDDMRYARKADGCQADPLLNPSSGADAVPARP